jgi:hypothetical protein
MLLPECRTKSGPNDIADKCFENVAESNIWE